MYFTQRGCKFIFALTLFIFIASLCRADEIHLTGGKIIQGEITQDTDTILKMKTSKYGEVSFPKSLVDKIIYSDKEESSPSPTVTPAPSETDVATPTASPKAEEIFRPRAIKVEIITSYDAVLFGVVEEVYVRPHGGAWMPAEQNMQLRVKDEVRTGQGKVKMKMRGRGEVRLPPNSHLILLSIDPLGEKVTIELKGGRIWNNITPGGGVVNYTVRTPDLVAGVRGTLFKVSLNEAPGSRLAVFEGSVEAMDPTGKVGLTVEANQAVATDQKGQITKPQPVDPDEINEWTEWDEWALDVHRNIASRFMIGGEQIDQMAKLVAEDGKRYENIMNEANRQIIINKEAERIDGFKEPFMKFARDTGVFPTNEMGFTVLVEDPGLPGWSGPYIEDTTLPIMDRWGEPIYYLLKKSQASGNVYGEIHSSGPDGVYQEGKPGSDDIRTIVPYYTIEMTR